MTEKIPFSAPSRGRRKPRRRNSRRVLLHFILFAVLGVFLLAGGIFGQTQLHKIAEDELNASRQSLLISEASAAMKTAAEANAADNSQRTKISSGLSSKARSIKSTVASMAAEGKSDEEMVAAVVDTLSAAAVSRLTGSDEATQTLKTKVSDDLAARRTEMISGILARVNEAMNSMKMGDVRKGLSASTPNYAFMYYSPLMLAVGGVFLALALFLGYVQFFTGSDFRVKVAEFIEPMDYLLPFFVGVIVFTLYPTVRVFIMAFQERYKLSGEFQGWGLGNFRDVLLGPGTEVSPALGNTVIYSLVFLCILIEAVFYLTTHKEEERKKKKMRIAFITMNVILAIFVFIHLCASVLQASKNTYLLQALGNTFLYVLFTVPISVALSIVLAYLLNQKIRLRALFQTAYFLPMVTAATAVGMVWKFMFNGDYGIINWLLGLFGGSKIPWLSRPEFSMAVMVIYGIWDSLPMTIILLISGLQNIDEHYYTVAKVDGAKARRIFFRITVPLLSPTIGLVLIINSISAFKVFNSVVVLFSGTPGPMYNMYTMVYYIYEQINGSLEYGRAAAASLILFGVILVFTMVQRLIQRKWTYN